MSVLSVTKARQNLCNLVNEMSEGHQPVYIKGVRNDAILMSAKDYSGMKETLYLQSIPGLWKSIEKASATPLSECIDWEDLGW